MSTLRVQFMVGTAEFETATTTPQCSVIIPQVIEIFEKYDF